MFFPIMVCVMFRKICTLTMHLSKTNWLELQDQRASLVAGKESACNTGDLGLIPGLQRSPGEGNDYPLQYSCLENSMDCVVHGVTKSRTQLSDFHFHFSGSESFGAEIQKVNIFRGPLCRRPLTRRPWTYSAIILDT